MITLSNTLHNSNININKNKQCYDVNINYTQRKTLDSKLLRKYRINKWNRMGYFKYMHGKLNTKIEINILKLHYMLRMCGRNTYKN